MINVTEQLKTESVSNRNYYVTANVTLADGTKLTLEKKDFYLAGNGIVDSADSGDFPVGVAIEKTATLALVNDDGRFDAYNFNKARFVIFLNLQLSDRLETIKRGTFIVSKKPGTAEKINLTLLDRMHDADKAYDSKLSFPCKVIDVLLDACQQCGITLGDASFPNYDFQVQKAPSNTTFRAVIGMCAALAGGNARIDENDTLRVIAFDKKSSATSRHNLSSIRNLQYDFDEIEVTGISYTEDDTKYLSGEEGYVILLDDCQLLSGNIEQGLTLIGEQLIGLKMRPFSCQGLANGYATFGDPVTFADIKGRVFQSYATDIEFVFGGATKWGCNAKSAEEYIGEYTNPGFQAAVDQAKKEAEKKMSAYDAKLKQMNDLAANTLGFYYTEEVQEDGSILTYRHDKPTLEDSKVIYKTGTDGFFLSIDGGKTWKAGFDSNGDAVLNILYAIGIQAEWINTRGLTAKNNDGDVTLRVDADTGDVLLNVSSFTLKGKTIEDIAKESQREVTIPNFYGTYTPTLSNAPASSWKEEDYANHDGSIFMDFSANKTYMFCASAKVWKELDNSGIVNFETVFNALTDNGKQQGIYMQDGQLYINASYLKSGQISADLINLKNVNVINTEGVSTFCIDENGNVHINAADFSLESGEIIGTGVERIETYYLVTSKNTGITTSTSGWTTTAQTPTTSAPYLWSYQTTYLSNGKSLSTTPCVIGVCGQDGQNGQDGKDGQNGKDGKDASNLTQQQIFNILTNDGQTQGIYLYNGKLYINANYIDTGTLAGWKVDSSSQTLKSTGTNYGGTLELDGGAGRIYAKGNSSTYISGYGSISGTTIEGCVLETGQIYAGSFTGQNVTLSDACSASVLKSSGKVTAGTHIEATGHFYSAGTGTDLADLSVRGASKMQSTLDVTGGTTLKTLTLSGKLTTSNQINAPNLASGSGTTLCLSSAGYIKTTSSSKRYKKHISFMDEMDVKKLYDLRPVFFKYKDGVLEEDDEDCKRIIPGFYAELVAKYFPAAVVHNKKGQVEDWDVRKLVPAMLKLIQSQRKQITRLENVVDDLSERLNKLEKLWR